MENEGFETKGTKIKIVGVGGAGGNVLNDLINSGINGVKYLAINTDEQDLRKSLAEEKLSLGHLGAGAVPEIAKKAAEEKTREIEDFIKGQDMIFITAGMGGGTGTGASHIVAKIARELDILTVAIVTRPFDFEGRVRRKNAEYGIAELKKYVDILIVIPNSKLLEFPDAGDKPYPEHLKKSNEIIRFGIKGISELITKEGLINLDFADVESIIRGSGIALFGFGESYEDEDVTALVERVVTNPLLERDIKGATKILLNVIGGDNISLNKVQEISELIAMKASGNKEGVDNLIFGLVHEPERTNVGLTVIATGFSTDDSETLSEELYSNKGYSDTKPENLVPEFNF